MANIKISELNELSKVDRTDILPIVDVSANETKKVLVDNLIEKNVELLAISDTAPSEFEDGDKYYNTSTKKIYTAVDGSWSETGETPLDGLFYIVFNEQSSYAWNGSDLVSVGGGTEDIVISDTEPTEEGVKLFIDTSEDGDSFTEITNEYSTSTGKGYSANYINELMSNFDKIFGESSRISDIDTALETGVYQYISTTANVPSNINPYGTLIVFNSTEGSEIYIQQILIGNSIYGNYTKKVAIRTKTRSSNFGEWYYL